MVEREGFVIEIFLGLIFIVFLILMVLLFVNFSSAKSVSAQTMPTSINSYNTNNYNNYPELNLVQRHIHDRVYYDDLAYYDPDFYDYDTRYYDYDERNDNYLDYTDRSRLKTSRGLFGNKINDYEVYVKNEEYKGGLFEVTFYFEDHYGETRKASVTKYVPARQAMRFFYKDISPDRYEVVDWWYDVASFSKKPKTSQNYYSNHLSDDNYFVYSNTPTMKRYIYHD